MVDVNVTKFVDTNKLNKFCCKVEINFEDKRFSQFITNERTKNYLHYYIKKSFIKRILGKNPFNIRIVGYEGNSYRGNLKPFIRDVELFEFFAMEERDQFHQAIKKGLDRYFNHTQILYKKMLNS